MPQGLTRLGIGTLVMTSYATAKLRSWMFVPGNRDRFIQKAKSSQADAILLDIEDGVLPAEKPEARRMIATALGRNGGGHAASYD